MSTDLRSQAFVLGDWGTSRLRLSLIVGGEVAATRAGPGSDVMRGEETQIFGAQRLSPRLANGRHILVLPGTHSKWVELEDGKVLRFRTAFTGETYALLCTHSILLRAAGSADQDDDLQRGVDAGVQRAADLTEGLLVAMFEAWVQQLLAGRSRAWAAGFLSGLLIAYEIDSVGRTFHSQGAITVIGEQQLAALYRGVLAARARPADVFDGDACAIQGLLYLVDCLRGGQ